ncbi:MAG: hypothetical protein IT328_20160 [Caldilineaceae bacterium]|nr:hypothetical protein [Caldilineaceae bacterium]
MPTERMIDYRLPADDDAAEHRVLRLTLSEMNTLQHARWMRLQRETTLWATETLGVADGDEEGVSEDDAEIADRRERAYRRAAMLGALKRTEIGTCAPDADEPETWQETDLPKEWQSVDGFIDEMPWQLFDLWLVLAAQCNPGAFFKEPETEQKKRAPGQVSVRSLTKRLTV